MESGGIEPQSCAPDILQCPTNHLAVYLGGYPEAAVTPHDIYYYNTYCMLCQVNSLLNEGEWDSVSRSLGYSLNQQIHYTIEPGSSQVNNK